MLPYILGYAYMTLCTALSVLVLYGSQPPVTKTNVTDQYIGAFVVGLSWPIFLPVKIICKILKD
jgi:hypothetical protein